MKATVNITRTIGCLALVFLSFTSLIAQDKKERESPPATATGTIAGSNITIEYSQPSVKGRKIWGDLVPYNEVWRTGANEATTFETSKDITIEGTVLPAGKYSLFTIPGEKVWTIIFNTKADQWGAYKYDEKKDKIRITVKPVAVSNSVEKLVFAVEANKVVLKWEKLEVGFGVK